MPRKHTRRRSSWRRRSRRQRVGSFLFANGFTRAPRYAGAYTFYAVLASDVPKGPELRETALVKALPQIQIETILSPEGRGNEYVLYFTEGPNVLCIMNFTLQHEEAAATAELKMVSCPNKPTNTSLRPASAVMFYRLASILQAAGVEFIALITLATGERFWRLMELYETFGFACVPTDESYHANIGAATAALPEAAEENVFLAGERAAAARSTAGEYYARCSTMVGRVPVVLAATGALLGI